MIRMSCVGEKEGPANCKIKLDICVLPSLLSLEEGGDLSLVVSQDMPFSRRSRQINHGLSLSLLGKGESFVSIF